MSWIGHRTFYTSQLGAQEEQQGETPHTHKIAKGLLCIKGI
jgi:hypothetical protein